MRTIVESLAFHARKQPHRDALITADARLSYGEVWSRANAIAREFARSGVSPGDRVVLAAGKSAAFVCSYFAAHLALAVAVPLDPNAPEARRHELIERVRPKLAFVEGGGNNIGN